MSQLRNVERFKNGEMKVLEGKASVPIKADPAEMKL